MNGILWRSLRVPFTRPMARQMASHPTGEELGLTGWKYYFNAETILGRRNIDKWFMSALVKNFCFYHHHKDVGKSDCHLVYGSLIGGYLLMKLIKPKKEAPKEAK